MHFPLSCHSKIRPTLAAILLTALLASPAHALTLEIPTTPASLAELGDKAPFVVKVSLDKSGLVQFALTATLTEAKPLYYVAHFALRRDGKLLAQTDTPAYAQKGQNTFYFAVAPANLAEAELSFSISSYSENQGVPIPMPGSTIYVLNLREFVQAALPASAASPAPSSVPSS